MDDEQNTPDQHTVPAQQLIPKPIKSVRIAMYMLIVICGLALLSNVAHFTGSSAKLPKSPQVLPPSVVRPESLTDFQRQETATAEKLKRQAELTQKLIAKAKGAYESYSNILPCDPGLAGTRGAAADGTPILCGTDGAWHPAPDFVAARDPSSTPAADERTRRRQAAEDEAQRRRAERERHQQQALASDTVAVDFTDRPERTDHELLEPRESATVPTTAPEKEKKPSAAADTGAANGGSGKNAKYAWAAHTGKLYKVFEGTVLETVLTNRINGSFAGPINTMVTTDLWSRDHQKLLIPQGTRCFGTVSAVNSTYQQRLFAAFHRCVMPDGFPIDLDRFTGLNDVGETGLRDLVNHHYLQIFGASAAIGAIGGLAQIGNAVNGFTYDPSVAIRNGVSQEMAQESMRTLDHFLNQLPTFIVRERARVKIYLSADLDLPAYEAHSLDPTL